MVRFVVLFGAVALVAAALGAATASAVTIAPGFAMRNLPITTRAEAPEAVGKPPPWIAGLWRPTTIAFAPDGKLFVAEWVGRVKEFDSLSEVDLKDPHLSVDITDDVHSSGDRGLLGMRLDPHFGESGHDFIYLLYAYDAPIGNKELESEETGDPAPIHEQFVDGGDKCTTYSEPSECVVSGRVVRIELDPDTGVAVGGADDPPQQVLVHSWCQQFNSHSVGDLEFDESGALLVSGGEGSSYTTADYGQFENPCGDPPNEGGSLRAQDVRTPRGPGNPNDRTDYSGSIIRIDPETGAALPDNPLYKNPADPSEDNPDVRARRILGYGLRNPYRFAVRPGTDQVYIGDVGQDKWDELDRITSPPAPGQAALNFGWPCYEGGSGVSSIQPNWDALNKPLCESLYEHPGSVTPSLWAYAHGSVEGRLFSGDQCDSSPGSAFAGLAFYERGYFAPEVQFPQEYDGGLFMADAARGCIWVMKANSSGEPDPTTIQNFATSDAESQITPVDLTVGPNGSLFAPDIYGDSIHEFRHLPAPVAKLTVDRADGELPLTVHFDASASTDPSGKALHYEWDLDGDGEFDDGTDSPMLSHTYTSATNVVVKVRVRNSVNLTEVASVTLYPGDKGPPQPQILGPAENLNWTIGDTISYSGTASDPDGGTVGNGISLHWVFNIRHCPEACHTHPLSQSESASGSFIAPPHEYPSHLLFELTATDNRGRSTTVTRDVYPKVVQISVASDPDGIPITVEGRSPADGPLTTIAGSTTTVTAPQAAEVEGVEYHFGSWSDGGAAVHEITALDSADLVAHYLPPGIEPPPGEEEEPKEEPKKETVRQPPPEILLPGTAEVRMVSKPRGVKLWIDSLHRRSPFSTAVATGGSAKVFAPKRIKMHGRLWHFTGWRYGGKIVADTSSALLPIPTSGRYVASYGR